MFSIENFYYTLYTNLLKPSHFNGRYFYPFGSTNASQILIIELVDIRSKHDCMFHDQEPIFENTMLGTFDKACNPSISCALSSTELGFFKKKST